MKYKLIFDTGKPYEEQAENEEELKQKLKEFYEQNKDSSYDYDVKVYDDKGKDISENQFIQEIISDITREF